MPANNNTDERTYLKVLTDAFELPVYEPKSPPKIAASIHIHTCVKNNVPEVQIPAIPAAEFTNINNADTAAVSFMFAQCINNKIGLKKIPPPIPIIPETNPSAAPISIPASMDNLFEFILSLLTKMILKTAINKHTPSIFL